MATSPPGDAPIFSRACNLLHRLLTMPGMATTKKKPAAKAKSKSKAKPKAEKPKAPASTHAFPQPGYH